MGAYNRPFLRQSNVLLIGYGRDSNTSTNLNKIDLSRSLELLSASEDVLALLEVGRRGFPAASTGTRNSICRRDLLRVHAARALVCSYNRAQKEPHGVAVCYRCSPRRSSRRLSEPTVNRSLCLRCDCYHSRPNAGLWLHYPLVGPRTAGGAPLAHTVPGANIDDEDSCGSARSRPLPERLGKGCRWLL